MGVCLFTKVDAILARSQPRDGTTTESTPHLPHTRFAIYIYPRHLVVAESIATLLPRAFAPFTLSYHGASKSVDSTRLIIRGLPELHW